MWKVLTKFGVKRSKEVIDGETERLENMWKRKQEEIKGLINKDYEKVYVLETWQIVKIINVSFLAAESTNLIAVQSINT